MEIHYAGQGRQIICFWSDNGGQARRGMRVVEEGKGWEVESKRHSESECASKGLGSS